MGDCGLSRCERLGDLFLRSKQGQSHKPDCIHSCPADLPRCDCRLALPRQPLFGTSCECRHVWTDRSGGRNSEETIEQTQIYSSLETVFRNDKEGTMNGNLFVFRPGGPSVWNVFNDWPLLVSAMSCVDGRKMIEFDDSLAPCDIPAGTWPMKDVMWAGFGPRQGKPRPIVNIL